MPGERPDLQKRAYDRRFLLGEKRNELVDLWQVQRYGRDAFGDPDFVVDLRSKARWVSIFAAVAFVMLALAGRASFAAAIYGGWLALIAVPRLVSDLPLTPVI